MPIDSNGVSYQTVAEALEQYRKWQLEERPKLVAEMDAYRRGLRRKMPTILEGEFRG